MKLEVTVLRYPEKTASLGYTQTFVFLSLWACGLLIHFEKNSTQMEVCYFKFRAIFGRFSVCGHRGAANGRVPNIGKHQTLQIVHR